MEILRTDGGGSFNKNERLIALREILQREIFGEKIYFLHDHKGLLSVNWLEKPNIDELAIVKKWWAFFGEYEITHAYRDEPILINFNS